MERELKDFKGANNAHEERMCLIKRVMRDDNTIQYHFIPTPPCAAFFLLIMCLCEGGLIISCRHYIALKIRDIIFIVESLRENAGTMCVPKQGIRSIEINLVCH